MSDPRSRSQVVVAAIVVGGALIAGAWYGSRPAAVPWSSTTVAEAASAVHTVITVHVAGAVVDPGLVTVAPGSRVADAIAAAGGARLDADLGALNLAATVVEADRIVVPTIGTSPPPNGGSTQQAGVDLNTADAAALESLPGVGPVLAARIVAHRELHGPFATVEDLLDVPGIGEAKLAAIRDAVSAP